MNTLLKDDPILNELMNDEEKRQRESLELIASENITSQAVLQCLGSTLTNKYSEGLPNKRYYGGNQVIDKIESLCISRALETFHLDEIKWGVNVQPYSGSSANFAVYTALLNPHDRIMGLDLPSGGHLTHGFFTKKKKISATSLFFESLPYNVDSNGFIDYDNLEKMAISFKPKLIICGYSAYSRDLDYERFRKIADINDSYLLCDMAHFSGFVATQLLNNPFEYCDIVTTTTHKSLRGPRAGMIFFKSDLSEQINQAVFPMLQGGPHQHQIAGIATQLLQVQTPEFKNYMIQVRKNAQRLCSKLMEYGYDICTSGTENHQFLLNLKKHKITGSKIEKICECVNISVNKNSVHGDKSALSPGGIRIGTCSVTTRGMTEEHMDVIAEYIHETIQLGICIQNEKNVKLITDFIEVLSHEDAVSILKKKVIAFASSFDLY